MRKGLFIALMMVAVMALVVPVSALAPLVSLPDLVLGDNGDTDGGSGKSLFRYLNAVDLSDALGSVQRFNGFTDDEMHVYYLTDNTGVVKVSSSTAIVAEIDGADLTNLGGGTLPAAAKDITDSDDNGAADFFWLSLINDATGTLSAATAYAATPAADGDTIANYGSNIGAANPVMLTLVVAETDAPTTYGQGSMSVYSIAGADDGLSSAQVILYQESFGSGAAGWTYVPANAAFLPYGINPAPTGTATGGSLVHQGSADLGSPGNPASSYPAQRFGSWRSNGGGSIIDVSEALVTTGGAQIIHGAFTLSGSAADPINTPGFRFYYYQIGFSHQGGTFSLPLDTIVGNSLFLPSAGSPVVANCYWALPVDTAEMGDTGTLATFTASDLRDYGIDFDIVDMETKDTGTIAMDEALVTLEPRPAATGTPVIWGTGGIAFNALPANGGWDASIPDPSPLNFPVGTAAVFADSMTFNPGTGTTGYKKVAVYTNVAAFPPNDPDTLYRARLNIASSDVNRVAAFRLDTLTTRLSNGGLLGLFAVDQFDPGVVKNLYSPADGDAGGAPKQAGSVIEVYLYTHGGSSGADAGILAPLLQVFNTGIAPGSPAAINGWTNPTGTYTVTGLRYTACN